MLKSQKKKTLIDRAVKIYSTLCTQNIERLSTADLQYGSLSCRSGLILNRLSLENI